MYFIFFCCNRERLIHVLALRPYKKPELYDRINKGETKTSLELPEITSVATILIFQ